jgi:hypothetical protein
MVKGDRIIKELDVLRKNILELQKQLQQSYVRIGELTEDLHELRKQTKDEKKK